MNSIGVELRASDGHVLAKLECQPSPMMLAEPRRLARLAASRSYPQDERLQNSNELVLPISHGR
jgi:hypothetical protein